MSVELIFCTGNDDADSRVGDGPLESARPMTPSATSGERLSFSEMARVFESSVTAAADGGLGCPSIFVVHS